MPSPKKKPLPTRFDRLSDEEIMARWKSLQPKFLRSLAFFAITAAFLFGMNHFFGLSQTMTDIANVAFQISSIFAVCFLLLAAMGFYFGSGKWIQSARSRKT